MKKTLLYLAFFLMLIPQTEATHLVGGYMSYEYLGRVGTTNQFSYRVSLTIYRDCANGMADFDNTIDVCIYNKSNNRVHSVLSIAKGPVKDVDPVGFTNCPQNQKVCLEVCVYEKIVNLPQSNFGYILQWQRCCRNTQVNLPNQNFNGVFQPSQGQTYQAEIPPTSIVNSSPYITDVPVPFICRNDLTQIRNSAIDRDGDSLAFKLVRPWVGGSLGDAIPSCNTIFTQSPGVTYNPGFNATQPFGVNGVADVNPYSGVLTALAVGQTGNYAIAIDVEEWRNGVLLSTVRLDLQLLVIDCAPNKPPILTSASRVFTREVVAGDELCFNITATDADDHIMEMQGLGEMFTGQGSWTGPLATLAKARARGTVTSQFCWKTSCEQARPAAYTFVLEVLDEGCPPKYINETYRIFVRPFVSSASIIGPTTFCRNESTQSYSLINTQVGSTFLWEAQGGNIISGQGTRNITVEWNNVSTGTLTIKETSLHGCEGLPRSINISILDIPPPPSIGGPDTICSEFSFTLFSLPNNSLDKRRWGFPNGNVDSSNVKSITFSPPVVGSYTFWNTLTNNFGCQSDTTFKTVLVLETLKDTIIGPKTICPNNYDIEFFIKNQKTTSTYEWFVEGDARIQNTPPINDTVFIAFGDTGTVIVKAVETNFFGCKGDTMYFKVLVTYDLIIDKPILLDDLCELSKNITYTSFPKVNRTTYFWDISGGNITEGQDSFQVKVDWGNAGQAWISVYQVAFDTFNSKQCISNTAVLDVTLRPLPSADQIEGVFEVCQETGPIEFTIKGFPNSTYLWTVNKSNALTGQGTNTIKFPTTAFGTFEISVFETTEYGCTNLIVDSVFIIHPKPRTSPISGNFILCHPNFQNQNYTVSGFSTSRYYWYVDGGIRQDSDFDQTTTVDWFGDQINSISVIEVSDFGCKGDSLFNEVFIDNPSLDMKVVTVNPPPGFDNSMIIKWEIINAPRYDNNFTIERKRHGIDIEYENVGSVSGITFDFVDENLNTDINPFDYRIKGVDLCKQAFYSPVHTNVLLTGNKIFEYSISTDFSDYLGWEFGVESYNMHRKLVDKSPFESYDIHTSPVRIDYNNGLDHYTQCYRVLASENSGRLEQSWSNEICFNFPPLLFIPNAFSPNASLLNDYFEITSGNLKTFTITIFNRWGEKLFESNNPKVFWDGKANGQDCQQGVYVYVIEYTDFADLNYLTKGTIHLLR